MKKILVLFICILSLNSFAQDLLNSRKTSYYTYIFRITDKEAEDIYKSDLREVDKSYFHTLVDSFPTDSNYQVILNPGHYLKAFTDKELLKIDITSVQNFDIRILNNNSDLCIQVYNSIGNTIPDAKVLVKRKKLRFDYKTQTYRLKKSNKKGLLKVSYDNQMAFYNLEKQYKNSRIKRVGKKIIYNPPVKYVWLPVNFAIRIPFDGVKSLIRGYSYNTIWNIKNFFEKSFLKIACYFDDWYCDEDYSSKFDGYLVFNKPKYQPKDTVKFKAFIVDKKERPINEELNVILYKDWKNRINLSKIKPYNEGGYSFEFYLHDSLNLKLDKSYQIYLEDNTDDLISGNFKYEDYELTKSKLEIRTSNENHYRNEELKLYVKGTDENDMSLLDASIEVLISNSNVQKYFANQIFVPDTLWTLNKKLDASDETEITIPDSIFPLANLEYLISVRLNTSDNEKLLKSKTVNYFYNSQDIDFNLEHDSISFKYHYNGMELTLKAVLVGVDNFGNKFHREKITLPYSESINPYFSYYIIESDSIRKTINIDSESSLIQCMSERTIDTVHIVIDNPRKIPFNYYVYRLNKEIDRGFSKEKYVFKEKAHNKKNYYVSLQYVWGGKVNEEDFEIPLDDKKLDIKVTQPKIIYPGQEAKIKISVKDVNGKPVPNVDLTAYGLTKKFNYNPPSLPNLVKERRKRELINKFRIEEISNDELGKRLDYNQWCTLAEIDSIEYYKFIYPGNSIYKYSYTPKNEITQFAPFVFQNGKIQSIGIIYVDRRPVYFNWSTDAQPYSFRISSGYHKIEIRTTNKSISIDSVYFEKNKKTIFSVNDNLNLPNVKIQERPRNLSKYEKDNLYKYIFAYRSNFGERYAYIKQNDEIYLLNSEISSGDSYPNYRYRGNYTNITGPIFQQYTSFNLIDEFNTTFRHEPFFEYDFSPNLLKMRSVNTNLVYPNSISAEPVEKLDDIVFTEESIKSAWEKYLDQKRCSEARYDNPKITSKGNGGLQIELRNDKNNKLIPLNILLFKSGSPKFLRVYPGNTNIFNDLNEGYYKLIVFYSGSKYNLIDSLKVQANGLNFFKVDKPELFIKDNFSIKVSELIKENIFKPKNNYKNNQRKELNRINNIYHSEYTFVGYARTISGYVYGKEDGLSIPGVSVVVKGSPTIGTTTDIDGFYSLDVPGSTEALTFSFVGLKAQEVPVYNETIIDVNMEVEVLCMDAVVVTALGVKTNKSASVSHSVSNVDYTRGFDYLLMGEVAGVHITQNPGAPGSSPSIKIRGTSSVNDSDSPLYIVDGVPYLGEPIDLNTDLISNIEVIKDPSMTAIYGSLAANGVVIITTKDNSFAKLTNQIKGDKVDFKLLEATNVSNSIRDNFSDYAFWQPNLKTDSEGNAYFNTTFPDDVTNWSTYVLAMNSKKQTGQTKSEIKSYKPLMAQLALPRFLIEKDSTYVIGKTLNYTLDSIDLSTNFELNDSIVFTKKQTCINSIIDSLFIVPVNDDTIKAKYYLEKPDGYFDGELRELPVFKKGLEETKGNFYVLNKDTIINLQFDDSLGTVNLFARSDELDVIDEELDRLINYRYLCNEQLASKLKANLAIETISQFKDKKKDYNRQINRIIKKLENNQNLDGLWGWWNSSVTSNWISMHVLEALVKARELGYKVKFKETKIADDAIWKLESDKYEKEKIRLLHLLKLLNVNFDYNRYIEKFDSINDLTAQEEFRLIELKQLCNHNYDIGRVLNRKKETLFGNIYFESDRNSFNVFENEVQLTLIAYRIIKRDSIYSDQYLSKIRNYLFEKRMNSNWGNTYESSQIIETILTDLLNEKKSKGKQEVIISGFLNEKIDSFPYYTTFLPDGVITIKKTGNYPIYLNTYQNYWNKNPKRKMSDFEINTHFKNKSLSLKAGEPEKLIVDVTVKKDADYIMIEIPIPAGCSYNSKKSWYKNEIHREYFKNQVTIFCDRLEKGAYQFEIDLLPRYSGKYTLNPAKIELMYFPTFSANNELKKVKIE